MSSHLSNNDDDLFDYEPETSNPSSTNSFSDTGDRAPQSDLYNNIKSDFDDDLDITGGNIHHSKAKLSISYHHALDFFIKDVAKESLAKSLHIVLDRLTNGDFSLISLFYETEMKISRKMLFVNLYHSAFGENGKDSFKETVGKILNIEFTSLYTQTCFDSVANVTLHTLQLDRALYLSLSNQLGIPVQQYLFDDPYELEDVNHKVYLADYKSEIGNTLSDTILGFGLLKYMEDLFGQPTITSYGNVE